MPRLMTNPPNEYIIHNPLWRVTLNNGVYIYQNDYQHSESSWLVLKKFLDNNRDKYITEMCFLFRDHFEGIGYNQPFFFFTKKMLAGFGSEHTQQFYVGGAGTLEDGIKTKHFIVPELILKEEDTRDVMAESCRRGVIAHPDYRHLFDEYYDE